MTDPRPIIIVTHAATTIGGATAAGAVTKSLDLKAKTSIGVIEQEGRQKKLSIYRESAKVSGQYSRDVYVLERRQWKYRGKDPAKHPVPPFPPAGAHHYIEGEVDCWTMKPMTVAEKERLKRLLTQL
jgi:hypothetical protein